MIQTELPQMPVAPDLQEGAKAFSELKGLSFDDAIEKVDEIAERVLTLEGTPLHSYSAYMKQAEIKEVTGVSDGNRCVKEIVENLGILIRKEREILALAAEIGDDGTQDMINPYISEQEKNLWMLRAYLSE